MLARSLFLPAEITEFERGHLRRMNRVAMAFFAANLPLFVVVAYANGTGPGLAAALTALVLVGPALAMALFTNPRSVSLVHGFTAMSLGGLLVHFGQGPMQIEMHFYFFSLLACLAMFGNPLVIVVAAVTVTLHHTVIWLLIPQSVFNYDASIWVVGVHAAFVVVESAAAIFIARSFFDNVIGLERIVARRTAALDARNRDMRMVLDHVDQGLFTMDRAGVVAPERSARTEALLPSQPTEPTFGAWLERVDPVASTWLGMALDDLDAGLMPLEVILSQLPARFVSQERHIGVQYLPIFRPGAGRECEDVERLLVVLSDETAEVHRQAAQLEQQETVQVYEQYLQDRSGMLDFFTEAWVIVRALSERQFGDDRALCLRWLHTLKGNAMTFGLKALGQHVHELEDVLGEEDRLPTSTEIGKLRDRWVSLAARFESLVGDEGRGIALDEADYHAFVDALRTGTATRTLLRMARSWRMDPAGRRLQRFAVQARRIAEGLGKALDVEIADHGVRLDTKRFSAFWSELVHVIRNAVDHGLESPEDRHEAGKSEAGTLRLQTAIEGEHLIVEISDDGRGLDWDRLRARAADVGLPSSSEGELVAAMFVDGVSTRDDVTSLSGRGVGLAAVKAATDHLGGDIVVRSTPGAGTTFLFRIPLRGADDALVAAA